MWNDPANDNAPLAQQHTAHAARDLEALAQVMGPLFGSAYRMVERRGGLRDDGPSERTRALLPSALRAIGRLTWLRAQPEGAMTVRVLVATHVYAGDARRVDHWAETVRLLAVSRKERIETLVVGARSRSGPDARAARAAGQRMLSRAESDYASAGEMVSDGRWLTDELDAISRQLIEIERERIEVRRAGAGRAAPSSAAHKRVDSSKKSAIRTESDNFDTERLTHSGQRGIYLSSAQLRPQEPGRADIVDESQRAQRTPPAQRAEDATAEDSGSGRGARGSSSCLACEKRGERCARCVERSVGR